MHVAVYFLWLGVMYVVDYAHLFINRVSQLIMRLRGLRIQLLSCAVFAVHVGMPITILNFFFECAGSHDVNRTHVT
jgi:hypothetical protein